MKLSIEQKAINACKEYVRTSEDIRRIGREIGDALIACLVNSKREVTHLSDYYRNLDKASEWAFMGIGGVDHEAEFLACPHCVLANKLIQIRKSARRRLGQVKAQITKIGKL